jgi:tartrate-resistant acid phosphatase type 5
MEPMYERGCVSGCGDRGPGLGGEAVGAQDVDPQQPDRAAIGGAAILHRKVEDAADGEGCSAGPAAGAIDADGIAGVSRPRTRDLLGVGHVQPSLLGGLRPDRRIGHPPETAVVEEAGIDRRSVQVEAPGRLPKVGKAGRAIECKDAGSMRLGRHPDLAVSLDQERIGEVPGLLQHGGADFKREVGAEPQVVDHPAPRPIVVSLGEEVKPPVAPHAEGVGQKSEGGTWIQPQNSVVPQRFFLEAGFDAEVSETDAPDILGHCSDLTASSPWSNAAVAQVGRRTLLGGLASLASLPALAAARTSAPEGFVAIGDWGRKGEPVQRAVASSMGEAAREVQSRFVISSGDNFYPGGVTSIADPHWRQSFEDVYVDPSLQTTWYASLGNHDYRGVPQAQVDYSRHSRRWRMPAPYYRVPGSILGVPSLDLFVMDTSPFVDDLSIDERVQQLCRGHWWEQETQPQIAWLKAALARSRAPWKIVVGHHPIYSGAHGDSPVLIARVAPILEAFAVQAYINGHDHDLQHVRRGRVDYICTGAGAEASNVRKVAGTRFCVGRPGFAAFRLGEDALELQFRAADGQTLYRTELSRRRV